MKCKLIGWREIRWGLAGIRPIYLDAGIVVVLSLPFLHYVA